MPSSLIGLVLFVALLTPGLAYFSVRDRRIPQRDLSTFRETGEVLLASLACDLGAASLFAVLRGIFPHHTPDIAAFAKTPSSYLSSHLPYVWWWSVGLLALATLAGGLLGLFGPPKKLAIRPKTAGIRFESAWHQMFNASEEKYCGCELDDGSWVGGFLASFSSEVKESGDRDLVLGPPITVKKGDGDPEVREKLSAVILSASRIVRLEVALVPLGTAAEELKAAGLD